MITPIRFSLPQEVCLVGLFACVLVTLSAIWQRRFVRAFLCGASLVALWYLLLGVYAFQPVLGFSNDLRIAEAKSEMIGEHSQRLTLVIYHPDGTQEYAGYNMLGDGVQLRASLVKYHPWVNAVGVHVSYQLTSLESYYADTAQAIASEYTLIELLPTTRNANDAYNLLSPHEELIEGRYGSGVLIPGNGLVYNMYVSVNGLYAMCA